MLQQILHAFIPASDWKLSQHTQDAPLCSNCALLDLRRVLTDGVTEKERIPIGSLSEIVSKSTTCGLCRQVSKVAFPYGYSGQDLDGVQCFLVTLDCRLRPYPPEPGRRREFQRLQILFDGVTTKAFPKILRKKDHIQLLGEDAALFGRAPEVHGRQLGPHLHPNLVKMWLRRCEKEHQGACESSWRTEVDGSGGGRLPHAVRLIDVKRMALVQAPSPNVRYFALSYVWGNNGEIYRTTKANIERRRRTDGLERSYLPQSILDSMDFVKYHLRERYLWVDALCIVQDDAADKLVQIGAMGTIYGAATATIFAAGCRTAYDPLPGFRPDTRETHQLVERIQGIRLAVVLRSLEEMLDDSVWNTRGWTFQELLLSRRRIFFTAEQVFFECTEAIWHEDCITDNKRTPKLIGIIERLNIGLYLNLRNSLSSWRTDFARAIEQFTRRDLTNGSDFLFAIAAVIEGIGKGMQNSIGATGALSTKGSLSHYGLLVQGFNETLLWQPTLYSNPARRVYPGMVFPSWSWAGWYGAVSFDRSFGVYRESDNMELGVRESLVEGWYLMLENGTIEELQVPKVELKPGPLHLEQNWKRYCRPQRKLLREDVQRQVQAEMFNPGTLVFLSSCALFPVAGITRNEGIDVGQHYGAFHIYSDRSLSVRIGQVLLPLAISDRTVFQFVVLSREPPQPDDYDESVLGQRYHGCMLSVMAIMKREKVYERVGIGAIFEGAWLAASSEEKVLFIS